jgi:hypothetical protein
MSERDRDTASKKEGRESENPRTTGSMRDAWQRMFRCTWAERVREREKMMTRFRCGNEERENRYWTEEEEERRCRMCREETEKGTGRNTE